MATHVRTAASLLSCSCFEHGSLGSCVQLKSLMRQCTQVLDQTGVLTF